MSQQYYYNSAAAQYNNTNVTQTLGGNQSHPGGAVRTTSNIYNNTVNSAHRSSAPVTYTYPSNSGAVVAPPVAVVPAHQATLVAPTPSSAKVTAPTGSYIITNGPSGQPTSANNPYALTTSYIQQIPTTAQTQITHHQSMAFAAAHQSLVQAASRGRKKPFNSRGGSEPQMFYCDVCKVSCAGPQTYKEHLDGQKHKKKAAGSKIPPQQGIVNRSSQRQLRCELCDVVCTGVDAYQAHVRGTKHQKTLKLHQRLGKPIPSSDPVVVKEISKSAADAANAVISAAPKIKFINKVIKPDGSIEYGPLESASTNDCTDATASTTTEISISEEHVDISTIQEKNVAPVGGEYIETTKNECGKIIQFYCKLCSCKFNDPHAKEMHLKGRRHRLQYKKKVDPSLIVDVKLPNNKNWKQQEEKMKMKQQREESWRRRDMQTRLRDMQRLELSNVSAPNNTYGARTYETLDDKHIMIAIGNISPSDKEIQAIQTVVNGVEKSLRQLSEIIFEDKPATEETEKKEEIKKEKSLCGAMRVGPLAKGLLLKGDTEVSLILLCSKWPTMSLINKIFQKLPDKLKEVLPDENLDVSIDKQAKHLVIKSNDDLEIKCFVKLTSSIVREESSECVQPEDGLDRKRCLEALALLRHTKWFQAKVSSAQPCLILIRLIRDLCRRVPTWNPLSDWTLELLTEKIISSESIKLSPGLALRRFFECLASGILLPGGPGIKDPCEKEMVDATISLTEQEREDITASAQHALRLIAFRQIHKVLGISAIDDKLLNFRKRRHSEEEANGISNIQKKDKRDAIKSETVIETKKESE